MAHGFATKELSDARERLQEGEYYPAGQFVLNAKRDIEDYEEGDYGEIKEEFDDLCSQFQDEASKGSSNWHITVDVPDHPYDAQPDDDFLVELLDKMEARLQAVDELKEAYREYLDLTNASPTSDKKSPAEIGIPEDREHTCIRCEKDALFDGFSIKSLPEGVVLCSECVHYFLFTQHKDVGV